MTLEISKSKTANGVGEFVRMDQGDTVLAGASPGESGTTLEIPKDNGEGEGRVGCEGLGETRGGYVGTGEVRKGDRVCRGERGSGMSAGETGLGWAMLWSG